MKCFISSEDNAVVCSIHLAQLLGSLVKFVHNEPGSLQLSGRRHAKQEATGQLKGSNRTYNSIRLETDRQTEQADRQPRQTDRQPGRQTDRHPHTNARL